MVVVEVVSPDDESYAKFGFYAAHGVDEMIIADPAAALVRIYRREADHYDETGESWALAVTADELTRRIDWP